MDISYYKKYEPIFGAWHIVREIGEGNFGKVFEIERKDFGRIYKAALKVITVPKNQSELKNAMLEFDDDSQSVTEYFRGFVEEMVDEFTLMSRLKGNSNIVSYEDHAVFEHDDGFGWDILIRMELLTTMLDYMHSNPFGTAKIIKLGADMCKALEHCGKLNIIHRDIKPENIFVSEFGDFKLGDFGVARVAEETMGNMSRKGTYNYMAPEVYKGDPYGADVDTYSLGLMLFRLLNNNRAPFLPQPPAPIKITDREDALTRRIKGEEIPAPANADEELSKIILKACAYNPKDRYASPTEMRLALESLGEKPAVSAPAVEKKTEDISEAKTVSDAETDRKVSLLGAVEKKEVIRSVSEAEKTQDIEEEIDRTVSVFGVKDKRAISDKAVNSAIAEEKQRINEIANFPKTYADNHIIEASKTERIEAKRTQNNDGKWKIENVYDENDLLMMRIEYTSLGNRFKTTFYDKNGRIEKIELYDYLNRIRKRMFYNSDGAIEKCLNYEYKQDKCIETEE